MYQCINAGSHVQCLCGFFPAVREDRSPGGKHRHKRQRTDDIAMAAGEALNSAGNGQDFQDPLLDRLVAAQPDRIPKAEGRSAGNCGLGCAIVTG